MSPFKAPHSNAELFLSGCFTFHRRKKSRQRDTFALSETARLYLSPASVGPDSPTCRGARRGMKAKPLGVGALAALLFVRPSTVANGEVPETGILLHVHMTHLQGSRDPLASLFLSSRSPRSQGAQYKISKSKYAVSIIAVTLATESTKASRAWW